MKRTALILTLILAIVVPSLEAAVTIRTLRNTSELPDSLAPFARKGDHIALNEKFLALVGGSSRLLVSPLNSALADAMGCLLAFVPDGKATRALVQIGAPALRIQGNNQTVVYTSVRQEGDGLIAQAIWSGPEKSRLDVETRYDFVFDDGRTVLTSDVRNAGPGEITGISYGLGANALQNYNFSPFQATSYPELNFRVYQRPDHVLGWFNPNPLEIRDAPLPGRLRPGQSYRVSYTLLSGTDISAILDKLYALARTQPERATLEFRNFDGPAEVIVQEVATGATFFRAFMDKAAPLAFPLLKGTYTVRTHLFPAVREQVLTVAEKATATWVVPAPAFGKVHVSVKNGRGDYVPAKVSFIGIDPSPSPYFKPENPIVTGRGWERFKDSVCPPKDGLDVTLPAGTYLVTASRGPEYTRETRVIEVLDGGPQNLEFIIDKVVDTRGLVSLDSHMHTQNSDGAMLIPERLRSVLVEGIDVAVSTDHNYITDYTADLNRLGLSDLMAVIVGDEVTARGGSIHYNSFPVVRRPNEPNNGAIGVEDDTPKTLFNKSRTKDPGALIHVNHPRSRGLGYFLTYELDPAKAATARAPFDLGFDVMEVMNGARLVESNRQSIEDWFHLLNRGYAIRAVGTSDSHGIDGAEPGYSRTYVLYNGLKGKHLDAKALLRAVKEGRSFVSNGPIVSVKAGKASFGDLVKVEKGRLDLDVKVTGAPWLHVSEVRVIVNGERKTVLAVKSPVAATVKLDQKVKLDLSRDAWIAVEVVGSKSLFPLVQRRSTDGRLENAALPYALTNPILVDVDGNGRFDALWPEKVQINFGGQATQPPNSEPGSVSHDCLMNSGVK